MSHRAELWLQALYNDDVAHHPIVRHARVQCIACMHQAANWKRIEFTASHLEKKLYSQMICTEEHVSSSQRSKWNWKNHQCLWNSSPNATLQFATTRKDWHFHDPWRQPTTLRCAPVNTGAIFGLAKGGPTLRGKLVQLSSTGVQLLEFQAYWPIGFERNNLGMDVDGCLWYLHFPKKMSRIPFWDRGSPRGKPRCAWTVIGSPWVHGSGCNSW